MCEILEDVRQISFRTVWHARREKEIQCGMRWWVNEALHSRKNGKQNKNAKLKFVLDRSFRLLNLFTICYYKAMEAYKLGLIN